MKKSVLTLVLLTTCLISFAQRLTAMRDSVAGSYNFWLYEPGTSTLVADTTDTTFALLPDTTAAAQPKPLVLFLHGKSLSGTDLQTVRRYGTISALEMGLDLDAYVVAPQTYNGWNPERVWKLVDWTVQHYPIDTNRIYVLGMSMGGYGTLNLAATYPDKIAAAMALCGGANVKDLCGLNDMPLWILHGTADERISVKCSDKVVATMASCGDTTRLLYDRLPGQNHSILARIFYMTETYDWLFKHSLTDSARTANKDYDITVSKLGTAYRHLQGKRRHIPMINGTKTADTYSSQVPSQVYVVKKGDTLYGIARRHGTTVSKLCRLNGISENAILRIGQKIRLS